MGIISSSYAHTMGFGVSARGEKETTRSDNTLSHIISNKIKYLSKLTKGYLSYFLAPRSNQKVLEKSLSYFCAHKSSAKSVGQLSQAVFAFLGSLRRTRGRLDAPTQTCGGTSKLRLAQNAKTYRLSSQCPNLLELAVSAWLINPKPYDWGERRVLC